MAFSDYRSAPTPCGWTGRSAWASTLTSAGDTTKAPTCGPATPQPWRTSTAGCWASTLPPRLAPALSPQTGVALATSPTVAPAALRQAAALRSPLSCVPWVRLLAGGWLAGGCGPGHAGIPAAAAPSAHLPVASRQASSPSPHSSCVSPRCAAAGPPGPAFEPPTVDGIPLDWCAQPAVCGPAAPTSVRQPFPQNSLQPATCKASTLPRNHGLDPAGACPGPPTVARRQPSVSATHKATAAWPPTKRTADLPPRHTTWALRSCVAQGRGGTASPSLPSLAFRRHRPASLVSGGCDAEPTA